MAFKISTLSDGAELESLSVAKIISYPLEKAEYKPFAQGRLCVTPKGLVVQLWAFEVTPSPRSSLAVALQKPGGPLLVAEIFSDGKLLIKQGTDSENLIVGSDDDRLCPTIEPFWGEDLQGVYWGSIMTFSFEELELFWGNGCLDDKQSLRGNLYKLSDDPEKPHRGSFFSADFSGSNFFGVTSLGRMDIVSY